ncbi:ferredoxin [Mycobacterium europaeum]|uniref:Ferredoxin n=1 Tax=Mycobacterium europaeum TaxID=761804 RepID=A0A0U1D257_9MYCO|nr:ferredoxin [Mycobacterium europaeum]CQD06733.1 ferredoxin [Mycobacterium europaeum]
MKVKVDYGRCEGHAVCVGLAPSVFAIGDEDEQVRIINDTPDDAERSNVILAAKRCPTIAITVTG